MFMFKFFKGLLLNIFNQMFTRNEDMYNYFTRQSDKLHVHVSQLSAVYKGVSFWNVMSTKRNNNCKTRQSEMANTSPRHMPVLGNVRPIKIENCDIFFRDVISLLARVFILLIDTATQEVPMKNI